MVDSQYASALEPTSRPRRLFLSLDLPVGQREEVSALLAALPPEVRHASGLTWLDPARWHITLVFLGDVAVEANPRLVGSLSDAALGLGPTGALSLAGAGTFGHGALWLGVTDAGGHPPHDLAAAVAQLRRAVARAQVPYDRKPWRPHLSIARARKGGDVRPLRASLAGFTGTPWMVEGFSLVDSVLGPAPVHTEVASFRFGGGAA